MAKGWWIIILFSFLVQWGFSQNCNLNIKGKIYDDDSGQPLSYATILIQENSEGGVSDDLGEFQIAHLCPGEYHLIVSHIGCHSKEISLSLFQDTTLLIELSHSVTSLEGVTVKDHSTHYGDQPHEVISRNTITSNAEKNLSSLLENEAGVHLLKNGPSIAKPIVQGLYGNRLTVLNNGLIQAGQQWGNDHSPEIDPFVADHITLIKGASALQYGANNLGNVILVEPKPIPRDPHLHGSAGYTFETNGRGHTVHSKLEKYSPAIAWRISGTFKDYGDQSSPDYYLRNTGLREGDLALQIQKSWDDRYFFDFYGSTFNTELGILRGSQIGNLTDLENAFTREEPFYTEDHFIRSLEAPKQKVSHHLLKMVGKYYEENAHALEVVLGAQLNDRKEFDVRRGGRSDIPSLSLQQYTFNNDLKYTRTFSEDESLTLGNQFVYTDNTNNPETGILPLLPDYLSIREGLYSTYSLKQEKNHWHFGLRFDYEYQDVVAITTSVPREIERFKNHFSTGGGLITWQRTITSDQNLILSTGYAMRSPAINELYSRGLHQGVSAIEEGKTDLDIEKVWNTTAEYKWILSDRFSANGLLYYRRFNGYIFLRPEEELRLTIRGAFPVFIYDQTDAHIYGLDLSAQFSISPHFLIETKYSYLRGHDSTEDQPLVYMPPNSLYAALTYRSQNPLTLSTIAKLSETEIRLTNRYVAKQKHLLPTQDYVLPPDAYYLMGVILSTNLVLPHNQIRFSFKATNLLNTVYRDYLNRQRYFADDRGRSIVVGVQYKM